MNGADCLRLFISSIFSHHNSKWYSNFLVIRIKLLSELIAQCCAHPHKRRGISRGEVLRGEEEKEWGTECNLSGFPLYHNTQEMTIL